MKRDEYLNLRRPYEPESIRLVIIAEFLQLPESIFTNRKVPKANRSSRR